MLKVLMWDSDALMPEWNIWCLLFVLFKILKNVYKPYSSTKVETKSHSCTDLHHAVPCSFFWFRAEKWFWKTINCTCTTRIIGPKLESFSARTSRRCQSKFDNILPIKTFDTLLSVSSVTWILINFHFYKLLWCLVHWKEHFYKNSKYS